MLYYRLIEQHLDNQNSVFWDDNHSLSYMELHKAAMGFAKRIETYGKDGTVLIVSGNSMDTCITMLSCISCGIRYSVVFEAMTNEQKKYIIKNSDTMLIIGQDAGWSTDPEIPFLDIRDATNSFLEQPAKERKHISLEKDAYILYTSGTTEMPKGVLAGYSQIAFLVEAINGVLKNSAEDIIWNCLPLAFDYGMYQLFLALDSEASFYISNQPIIASIPKILADKGITAFPVVPSLIGMVLKTRLLQRIASSIRLRYVSSTGDTMPVSWMTEIEKILPGTVVVPMYGITECKRVAIMPLEDKEKKYQGSCGLPLPGVDVVLTGSKEARELVVYGQNVMKGYWKAPEETRKYFGFDGKRKQRYLKTGDLFRQDEDGYLYFIERKSGFIKSNGYRISGREIDVFLIKTLKGIFECCTVGVPDCDLGQKIVTVIYGVCSKDEVNKQIMQLPVYLKPHRIMILDTELPKTPNGKYDKKKIVEMAGKK